MIWPFKKKPAPHPDAVALLNELNKLLEGAPADTRKFVERIGPYAKPERPTDPLSEASVYLAYGRISGAVGALRVALSQPERIAELEWLPNGEEYVRSALERLERLQAAV